MGKKRDTVKEIVKVRDGGCVGRGQLPGKCGGGLTGHHIINRGMGGSKVYDGPEWRLTMCNYHNEAMESDANTAEMARVLGMKLRRNGIIPPYALVRYPDGKWYMLVGDYRVPVGS